jgi:catechol 2,3-dioxygenase-like lactoylglutathione lyase family enzyme
MITAIHTLIYSDDPAATRAFLRGVLGWPHAEDTGTEPGWLIFRTGPSEMGVHPSRGEWEGETYDHGRKHEITLMCDDVATTRADLEAKGATFLGPIDDEGWGLVTSMAVPGADPIMLYEPRHPTAFDL